jgi:hypothetical protein
MSGVEFDSVTIDKREEMASVSFEHLLSSEIASGQGTEPSFGQRLKSPPIIYELQNI